MWRKWGQFEKFTFSPPLPLRELLLLGIQHLNLDTTKLHGRTPDAAAEDFATLLTERASMFHEYWGIVIEVRLVKKKKTLLYITHSHISPIEERTPAQPASDSRWVGSFASHAPHLPRSPRKPRDDQRARLLYGSSAS